MPSRKLWPVWFKNAKFQFKKIFKIPTGRDSVILVNCSYFRTVRLKLAEQFSTDKITSTISSDILSNRKRFLCLHIA